MKQLQHTLFMLAMIVFKEAVTAKQVCGILLSISGVVLITLK